MEEVASFCLIEGNEDSDIDSSHGALTSAKESEIDADLFDESSSELGAEMRLVCIRSV
jgi:hypothetical protein